LSWFQSQSNTEIHMSVPIKAFKPKLMATGSEFRQTNSNLFMRWINELTTKIGDGKMLVLKPEYRK
jgi:hypothetical protein